MYPSMYSKGPRDQKGLWVAVEEAVLISNEESDSKTLQKKSLAFPKDLV